MRKIARSEENIRRSSASKLIIFCAFLVVLLLNYANQYRYFELVTIIMLVSALFLLYKSRNDFGHFLIFLFMTYALYKVSFEYLFNVRTTPYEYFYTDDNYNVLISVLSYFVTFIAIFYREKPQARRYNIKPRNNEVLYYILCIICLGILVFGVERTRAVGFTVSIKTVYEYFVIAVIFAYYYSGDSKTKKIFLVALTGVYILQDFYYGGRISSLQAMILLALLYFADHMNYKRILLALFPSMLIMNAVGLYRWSFSLKSINLSTIWNATFPKTYEWNTFAEVLYSSSGLVYAKHNAYSISQQLESFVKFFANIFVGGRNEFGNIVSFISSDISQVGGGGYLPVYFYFWLGWFGVALISYLICRILNVESRGEGNSDYYMMLNIVFVTMMPRWFAYTPLILFRFVILNYSIAYFSLRIIDSMTRRASFKKASFVVQRQ